MRLDEIESHESIVKGILCTSRRKNIIPYFTVYVWFSLTRKRRRPRVLPFRGLEMRATKSRMGNAIGIMPIIPGRRVYETVD